MFSRLLLLLTVAMLLSLVRGLQPLRPASLLRGPLVRSSTARHASSVKSMTAQDFVQLMSSPDARERVQIIDVREVGELAELRLRDPAVINLPLSEAGTWSPKVEAGSVLDATKAAVCVCKVGMRSMKVATFLAAKGFEEVYNLEGGMTKLVDVGPALTTALP